MGKIDIRQAYATDHQAIEICVEAAYAKYRARLEKEPAPLHADYQGLIAQQVVYVLINDEGIQGVLVMMPKASRLFVENIAVAPASQGQGYGRLLMSFAEQQARRLHLLELCLYTHERMSENLSFYRSLGFEEEARRIEDGYPRVFLRKELSERSS
jgi:GNAT superfamily N-acetyltransferase